MKKLLFLFCVMRGMSITITNTTHAEGGESSDNIIEETQTTTGAGIITTITTGKNADGILVDVRVTTYDIQEKTEKELYYMAQHQIPCIEKQQQECPTSRALILKNQRKITKNEDGKTTEDIYLGKNSEGEEGIWRGSKTQTWYSGESMISTGYAGSQDGDMFHWIVNNIYSSITIQNKNSIKTTIKKIGYNRGFEEGTETIEVYDKQNKSLKKRSSISYEMIEGIRKVTHKNSTYNNKGTSTTTEYESINNKLQITKNKKTIMRNGNKTIDSFVEYQYNKEGKLLSTTSYIGKYFEDNPTYTQTDSLTIYDYIDSRTVFSINATKEPNGEKLEMITEIAMWDEKSQTTFSTKLIEHRNKEKRTYRQYMLLNNKTKKWESLTPLQITDRVEHIINPLYKKYEYMDLPDTSDFRKPVPN